MEKKQTAVEWLIKRLAVIDQRSTGDVLQAYEQAKQMSRQEIEEAYKNAELDMMKAATKSGYSFKDASDYYQKKKIRE